MDIAFWSSFVLHNFMGAWLGDHRTDIPIIFCGYELYTLRAGCANHAVVYKYINYFFLRFSKSPIHLFNKTTSSSFISPSC